MRKMKYICAALFAAALCQSAQAATEQTASAVDCGGQNISGGTVAIDGTVGSVGSLTADGGGTQQGKMGYAGQLYDLTSLQVTASPTSVNEAATTQLDAVGQFDDDTFGALPGTPSWSIQSGPITSIDGAGLATASNVYQDTSATAQAVSEGATGTVALLVVNVTDDDFGMYAGDGMADAWQVGHWGEDNPAAAPGGDPDGDSQSNAYEYVTGTLPTNTASFFAFAIQAVVGVSTQMDLMFDPAYVDRTYTVEGTTDLDAGPWAALGSYTVATNGVERTVRDLIATNDYAYYRVNVQYIP